MNFQCKEPEFNIGQKVYHVTPDSPQGIVTDAIYSLLNKRWVYSVAFGVKEEMECLEFELSTNKTF